MSNPKLIDERLDLGISEYSVDSLADLKSRESAMREKATRARREKEAHKLFDVFEELVEIDES
jgi:hypothetical protein